MELVLCFYRSISKLYAGLCFATGGELAAWNTAVDKGKKNIYSVSKIYTVHIKKILFTVRFPFNSIQLVSVKQHNFLLKDR